LNIFDRLTKKRTEEKQPSVQPPPLPETKADPVKPIQVNDEKYVQLLRALRPGDKVVRILKDLTLDGFNAQAVVGGASEKPPAKPPDPSHEPPGPIV
jgi:hypothetical protein